LKIEKRKTTEREIKGKRREPYLKVGLPLGAEAAMVDRNEVGREEHWPAGRGERDEQAREISPGSIEEEAAAGMADAMGFANVRRPRAGTPVARETPGAGGVAGQAGGGRGGGGAGGR